LTEADALAAEDALKVSTFARIADIKPTGGREVFDTQDGTFLNALAAVGDRRMTPDDAERLVCEDLGRLLKLARDSPEIAEALDEIEPRPHWHVVLASVEDNNKEYISGIEGASETESRALRAAARDDLREIEEVTASKAFNTKLGPMFRLSRMPRSLFRLARDHAQLLSDISFLAPGGGPVPTPRGEESVGADALARLRDLGGPVEEEIEWVVGGVRLRMAAARHLLSDREFAKLDACEYKWPSVMARIISGPGGVEGIKTIESYFLDLPAGVLPGVSTEATPPPQKTEEEREFYEACMADDGLRRFLRIRPYFKDMDRRRLLERRLSFTFEPGAQLATGVAAAATAATPTTAGPLPGDDWRKSPPETSQETTPLDVTFVIRNEGPPVGPADAHLPSPERAAEAYYSVEVITPGGGAKYDPVKLSTVNVVRKMFESRGFAGDEYGWFFDLTKSLTHGESSVYDVTRAGQMLFDEFFGRLFPADASGGSFDERWLAGGGERELRVTVATDAPEVASLPWEMLKTPGRGRSLPLNPNVSLCRYVERGPDVRQPVLRDDAQPPRVGRVFAPFDQPESTQAARRLNVLSSDFSSGVAWLPPPPTPREKLTTLREKPFVLHVEASFIRPLPGLVPMLALLPAVAGSEGHDFVSKLPDLLLGAGVQLLTVGDNGQGGFLDNPLLEAVDALVRAGLPAAVVATRPVEETSAINFWRSFYGAWFSGRNVEDAVSGARLQISRNDWSAFALFGSPSVVGRLRLPQAL
jgi:hypothetical protein